MKVNSPESIQAAQEVFREYGSWTAAREAGRRDASGVLVIPRTTRPESTSIRPRNLYSLAEAKTLTSGQEL